MLSAQASAAGQAVPSWPGAPPDSSHAPAGSPQQLAAATGSSLQGHELTSPSTSATAGAPDTTSASSQQTSLFQRFSPEGSELFATSSSGNAAGAATQQHQHQHQQAALKQNLQKLYGSLGLQHGSRTSLPDIQEDEPQTSLPSDPPLAQRLPPFGRPPATRAMSDDDLFGMQDLGQAAVAAAAHASQSGSAAAAGGVSVGLAAGASPPVADLSMVGQLPAGASQSRTLFVRNVDPSVPEDELRTLFEAFGEVRSLYTAAKARGFVVVSYYDTRAATLARHTLSGQLLATQQLDVHFSLPKDDREAAQGTLLVASLEPGASRQELVYLFSRYGELRELADDPLGRPNCCLVEFYDTRHAAAALQGISQAPDLASRLVVMDASSAGVLPQANTVTTTAPAPSSAQLNTSLSHEYLAGLPSADASQPGSHYGGSGGGMRNVGSSPALLYASASHSSSSQLDYLLAGGNPAALTQMQQQQQQLAAAQQGTGGYDATAQFLSAAGLTGGDPLAGMSRSFSEMSLDGSSTTAAGLGGRFAPNSMSTGDLLALTQGLQSAPGGPGLRGIASTGSIWPHHQPHASLGSSPVGAGVWPSALGAGSHGSLQELLQKQAAVNAALQQQAAVNAAALLQQPNPLVQNAALQAAVQQALLTQQAAALLGHGGLAGAVLGGGGRRGVDPPLGGRLARRPLDPVAEAERRLQQEKLYSLDLNKIRIGEDKRTTLMIKNIPNKYTQKMLLALVEERFRGMFDFFYLPIDFKNKCNVGYAFINMVRPEYIIPLVEELHGKKWPKFNSEKICHIAYGRIQGKAALVQHFQNSSLLHEDKRCRPILFHSNGALAGEVEQFPGTLPSPTIAPAASATPGTVPLPASLPAAVSTTGSGISVGDTSTAAAGPTPLSAAAAAASAAAAAVQGISVAAPGQLAAPVESVATLEGS